MCLQNRHTLHRKGLDLQSIAIRGIGLEQRQCFAMGLRLYPAEGLVENRAAGLCQLVEQLLVTLVQRLRRLGGDRDDMIDPPESQVAAECTAFRIGSELFPARLNPP